MTEFRNYAVLWDMDGVLVDTGEFHYEAWDRTFIDLNISFDRAAFKKTFGMNNTGILDYMFGRKPEPEEVSKISDEKESLFRELIKGKTQLLPGVFAWLNQFQDWGIKQAITSSAPPENIEALIAELKIERYFDAIVSGFDLPGKPNLDISLKAAAILNIKPQNCIVVEDAIAGVEGAKRAGAKCNAVKTTNPASALGKADFIFDNLNEMSYENFLSLLA